MTEEASVDDSDDADGSRRMMMVLMDDESQKLVPRNGVVLGGIDKQRQRHTCSLVSRLRFQARCRGRSRAPDSRGNELQFMPKRKLRN